MTIAMTHTNGWPDSFWPPAKSERAVPIPFFRWQLDPSVTIGRALVAATQRLSSARLDSARLDAEGLLAFVLGFTRAQLYTYPERPLTEGERQQFEALVERRFKHEPVAYLVGEKSFYGLEFAVDASVLIPRPETELLVDLALELVAQSSQQRQQAKNSNGHGPAQPPRRFSIADVGTGSGAIAISIVRRTKGAHVFALDISRPALGLARGNARRHNLSDCLTFLYGDLLRPLPAPVDLIIANLPYVALSEWDDLTPDIAEFEPSLALLGGSDGLDIIRRLLAQAPDYLRPAGTILLEIGSGQGIDVAGLARKSFPGAFIEVIADYGLHDRIVRIQT